MKSPFVARGRVSVAAPNDGAAAPLMAFQLSRSLNPMRAQDIVVGEESVSFRGAVLRAVWGWNLLKQPLDRGTVSIRSEGNVMQVDYELRVVELPLLTLGISCVMSAPALLFGESITAVTAFLVFCGFFGTINYLLLQWRFQSFLRRVLRRANRRTMPPS